MDSLFQDEHINHDSPPSPNILIVPPEARGGHLFSVIWLSPSFRVFIINVNWELSLPGFWPNPGSGTGQIFRDETVETVETQQVNRR